MMMEAPTISRTSKFVQLNCIKPIAFRYSSFGRNRVPIRFNRDGPQFTSPWPGMDSYLNCFPTALPPLVVAYYCHQENRKDEQQLERINFRQLLQRRLRRKRPVLHAPQLLDAGLYVLDDVVQRTVQRHRSIFVIKVDEKFDMVPPQY